MNSERGILTRNWFRNEVKSTLGFTVRLSFGGPDDCQGYYGESAEEGTRRCTFGGFIGRKRALELQWRRLRWLPPHHNEAISAERERQRLENIKSTIPKLGFKLSGVRCWDDLESLDERFPSGATIDGMRIISRLWSSYYIEVVDEGHLGPEYSCRIPACCDIKRGPSQALMFSRTTFSWLPPHEDELISAEDHSKIVDGVRRYLGQRFRDRFRVIEGGC